MSFVRRPSYVSAVLAALACLLTLSACGGGARYEADDGEGGVPLAKGDAVPDVAFESLEGEAVRLADSDGEVLLLDFWATWCTPCREEIPMLNDLQANYGDRGLRIVAISDEESDVIRDFLKEHDVKYTNLIASEEASREFGVLALPMAYLVGRDGKIAEFFMGPKPKKILEKKIRELLEAGPAT